MPPMVNMFVAGGCLVSVVYACIHRQVWLAVMNTVFTVANLYFALTRGCA